MLAAPGVDINVIDKFRNMPLFYAAQRGHEAIVAQLLATPGIDVNAVDENGDTGLFGL